MWAIRYRDIEYPTDLEAEEADASISELSWGRLEGGGRRGTRATIVWRRRISMGGTMLLSSWLIKRDEFRV